MFAGLFSLIILIRNEGGEFFNVTQKNSTTYDRTSVFQEYCSALTESFGVNRTLYYSPDNELTNELMGKIEVFTDFLFPHCSDILWGDFSESDQKKASALQGNQYSLNILKYKEIMFYNCS